MCCRAYMEVRLNKAIIRIQSVELNNFRNIEHGKIPFACNLSADGNTFEEGSDILGIYGQNGSGKTGFIRALTVIDALMSGDELPKDMNYYITAGKETCSISTIFSMSYESLFYKIVYDVSLKKREDKSVIVEKEELRVSEFLDGMWLPMRQIVSYDEKEEVPVSSAKPSASFIFSSEIRERFSSSINQDNFKNIIHSLWFYAKYNFYTVENRNLGVLNANVLLPFSVRSSNPNASSAGMIPIDLEGTSFVDETMFELIIDVIETMNIVLSQMVPGLSIGIVNHGKQLTDQGSYSNRIELTSNREGTPIPLRFESDGIKKIISVLQLLMALHNNASMTLAIDELDSGVYEYLLGEILKIIHDTGKGQLIFTSHNLRPLETLDKESIIFTTSNPQNRYIRMTGAKTKRNLRDAYYHDLILGGQKECIYEPTNSYAISRAFRIAGESHEI